MKKLKIATILGTRPEIIRLSRVIAKLDQFVDHTLIHTGQNYNHELNEIFFKELNLRKPDFVLNVVRDNVASTIGEIISQVDKCLEKIRPDAVLVLGDTNSCLSVIAAKRRKIPIFHMEAGNRCFDNRVPEEINRRIVDHTADVNLTYTKIGREYLLREGIQPDLIIQIGSPMREVLNNYLPSIDNSNILDILNLEKHKFFLLSVHREENIDSDANFFKLVCTVNEIAKNYGIPIIFSAHPRTMKRIESESVIFHSQVKVLKPLGFFDYNKLQMNAKVVLSDSGTITEEASILGFKALNLREAHERPEGMEEAVVMMVGLEFERIIQCLNILDQDISNSAVNNLPTDYESENVSDKMVRIIHSYTDYVKRVVWKMY